MKAKQFKEVNAVYGENQPEYYPLLHINQKTERRFFALSWTKKNGRR